MGKRNSLPVESDASAARRAADLQRPVFVWLPLLSVLLSGACFFIDFRADMETLGLHKTAVELTQHIGRIMQLDEVLTMSAKMAAVTGDASYEARYRKFEPELNRIIKDTLALMPMTSTHHFVEETDAANQRLVEMEHQSFDLDHQGQHAEALALLVSPDYSQQKAIYAEGMTETFRLLQETLEHARRRANQLKALSRMVGFLWFVVVFVGVFITIWAVMARRKAEVLLRGTLRAMEHRVQERTASLRQANETLVSRERALLNVLADLKKSHEQVVASQAHLIQAEKLESIGRLAAGVAHEVKNPLSVILMGVDCLADGLTSEKDRTILSQISASAKRADTVIRGLLDFSASRVENVKPEDLNGIVEQALSLVKHELVRSHVTLVKELSSEVPLLQLERTKIEQIFINLFMNAVDAMAEEGTLTVRTALRVLDGAGPHIGHRQTDRFSPGDTIAVVEVDDTGPGIPAEHLSKLFEPFFTTKAPGKGTGLGLSVTKSLVESHGGMVDICNRPEGGARVTLMFPVQRR